MRNDQLEPGKNVPFRQLDYTPHGRRNIRLNDVIRFVEERFDKCKKGTDFTDVEKKFNTSKRRAQRILKRGRLMELLFAPTRTNPQLYFPESRHFEVIEYINNRKNVPKDTTGTSRFNSPLSSIVEQQKASNFLEALLLLKYISRQIHKLQLELRLENECYQLISSLDEWKGNRGRPVEEIIEQRTVVFTYYKNGKVVISVTCHNRPFNIETDDDLIILYSFIGQVRDRLENHIADPRGRLVPQIPTWILKQCDLNKDVPITDEAQLTLPDIQISTAFRVFRLYVKNLEAQAHYRCEESLQVNRPLQILDSMLNTNEDVEKKIDELSTKIDSLVNLINKNQNNSQNQNDYKAKTISTTSATSVRVDQETTNDNFAASMGALVNWYHHYP